MGKVNDSSAASDRHPPRSKVDRPSSSKSDQPRAEMADRSMETRSDRPVTKYLAVTVDADSARVIRVDGVDATGGRRELSGDERAKLVKDWSDDEFPDVVEQAFEAGIASVLGGDEGPTTAESPEDATLRHRLLEPLIERSAIGRLRERGALNRALLSTLIARETT